MLTIYYTERDTPSERLVAERLADGFTKLGLIHISVTRDVLTGTHDEEMDIDDLVSFVLELVDEVNALEVTHD